MEIRSADQISQHYRTIILVWFEQSQDTDFDAPYPVSRSNTSKTRVKTHPEMEKRSNIERTLWEN